MSEFLIVYNKEVKDSGAATIFDVPLSEANTVYRNDGEKVWITSRNERHLEWCKNYFVNERDGWFRAHLKQEYPLASLFDRGYVPTLSLDWSEKQKKIYDRAVKAVKGKTIIVEYGDKWKKFQKENTVKN